MTASRSTGRAHADRRRAGQVLLGLVATALFVGAGSAVALAHDGLVSSSPASDGVLSTASPAVELRFTGEPLPLGTQVVVTGSDGTSVSDGPAEIRGTAVVQPLVDPVPAGAYRVEWRSTSSDGHPLSGSYDFTVSPAAADAPAAPVAAGSPTAGGGGDGDAGLPAVYPLAGVGLLGALGLLTARRLRRRS